MVLPAVLNDVRLAFSRVDRDTATRESQTAIADLVAHPDTRYLVVAESQVLVGPTGGVFFLRRRDLGLHRESLIVYLGKSADGVAVFAVDVDAEQSYGVGARWAGLRDVADELPADELSMAATALAMTHWHRTHAFCGRTGKPTIPKDGGWLRVAPDGREIYPRTDPAVIVTVVDDEDRLLLHRGVGWPADRMSCIAGFVEPGESLEAAVVREVFEEVGVRCRAAQYLGSQPWPFPGSVMVGFTARAASTDIRCDGVEVEYAEWFTRKSYRDALDSGRLRRGNSLSISGALIDHWLEEDATP